MRLPIKIKHILVRLDHQLACIHSGVEQLAARSAHNAEVIGSSPVPARDTFNQPPRGVSWVMLMIKNFWFFLNKVAPKIFLLNRR